MEVGQSSPFSLFDMFCKWPTLKIGTPCETCGYTLRATFAVPPRRVCRPRAIDLPPPDIELYIDPDRQATILPVDQGEIQRLRALSKSERATYVVALRKDADQSRLRLARLAFKWTAAVARWKLAGEPMRTPEEIEQIHRICEDCEFYHTAKLDNRSQCLLCGCSVNKHPDGLNNKIAMATEVCPHKPPLWK